MHSSQALDEAEQLIKEWTVDDIAKARTDVTRLGLKTTIRGRNLQDISKDALKIARGGLKRRSRLDWRGFDETKFLKARLNFPAFFFSSLKRAKETSKRK